MSAAVSPHLHKIDKLSSSRCRICDASQLSGRLRRVHAAKPTLALKSLPMHQFFITAAIGTAETRLVAQRQVVYRMVN